MMDECFDVWFRTLAALFFVGFITAFIPYNAAQWISWICFMAYGAGLFLFVAVLFCSVSCPSRSGMRRIGRDGMLCLGHILQTPARFLAERRGERRRQRNETLRRRFPIPGKWPDRGWLVMLRARDQAAVIKPTPWLAPLGLLSCRDRREKPTLRKTVVFDVPAAGDGGADDLFDSNIDRCESGRSCLEFTRTVVAVVGIAEEGVFRNIVTFL